MDHSFLLIGSSNVSGDITRKSINRRNKDTTCALYRRFVLARAKKAPKIVFIGKPA